MEKLKEIVQIRLILIQNSEERYSCASPERGNDYTATQQVFNGSPPVDRSLIPEQQLDRPLVMNDFGAPAGYAVTRQISRLIVSREQSYLY